MPKAPAVKSNIVLFLIQCALIIQFGRCLSPQAGLGSLDKYNGGPALGENPDPRDFIDAFERYSFKINISSGRCFQIFFTIDGRTIHRKRPILLTNRPHDLTCELDYRNYNAEIKITLYRHLFFNDFWKFLSISLKPLRIFPNNSQLEGEMFSHYHLTRIFHPDAVGIEIVNGQFDLYGRRYSYPGYYSVDGFSDLQAPSTESLVVFTSWRKSVESDKKSKLEIVTWFYGIFLAILSIIFSAYRRHQNYTSTNPR